MGHLDKKFTKTTLKKIKAVLKSLRKGASTQRACEAAGVHRSSFYDWVVTERRNGNFEYDDIIDSRTMMVEDAFFINATKNLNVTAQIFWLKCRVPKRWREFEVGENASPETQAKAIQEFLKAAHNKTSKKMKK